MRVVNTKVFSNVTDAQTSPREQPLASLSFRASLDLTKGHAQPYRAGNILLCTWMIQEDKVKFRWHQPQTLRLYPCNVISPNCFRCRLGPHQAPEVTRRSLEVHVIRRKTLYHIQVRRRSSRVFSCASIALLMEFRSTRSNSTWFGIVKGYI
jgi:hypothetical protein